MINDIGTIKAVAPAAVPSESTKPVERVAPVGGTRKEDPAERGEKAKEAAESLDQVVSDLNTLAHDLHRELRFSVDNESGETVVKVVDSATEEVVRQIPSEEVVRLRKRLAEAAGVIFQGSA